MMVLAIGVALWMLVHLIPSLAAPTRAGVIARIGEGPYKGLFSLALLAALSIIVMGWRSASPAALYVPPASLRMLTVVLMAVALVLFLSARLPTDLKRVLRHPQLTGVLVWALAHLLSNGEQRSVVLFGALGAWAVIEMIAINRREGPRTLPASVGLARSAVPVGVGLVAWLVLAYAHPWIAGVAVVPAH